MSDSQYVTELTELTEFIVLKELVTQCNSVANWCVFNSFWKTVLWHWRIIGYIRKVFSRPFHCWFWAFRGICCKFSFSHYRNKIVVCNVGRAAVRVIWPNSQKVSQLSVRCNGESELQVTELTSLAHSLLQLEFHWTVPEGLSAVCVCCLQNTSTFTLERDEVGEVVMEDGRSRCPFNPEYKSTAIIVGM